MEGATGYTDTNFRGKGQRALGPWRRGTCLRPREAPDEMGHEAIGSKIRAIDDFDERWWARSWRKCLP